MNNQRAEIARKTLFIQGYLAAAEKIYNRKLTPQEEREMKPAIDEAYQTKVLGDQP